MENSYRFFENRDCKYFPCHKGLTDFNCLFCYCPLYALGSQCGGNCQWLPNGIKDCSACMLPHGRGSYEYITGKFPLVSALAKRNR